MQSVDCPHLALGELCGGDRGGLECTEQLAQQRFGDRCDAILRGGSKQLPAAPPHEARGCALSHDAVDTHQQRLGAERAVERGVARDVRPLAVGVRGSGGERRHEAERVAELGERAQAEAQLEVAVRCAPELPPRKPVAVCRDRAACLIEKVADPA